jgi:flagellar operon protein
MEIDNIVLNRVSQIRPITTGTPVTRSGEITPQSDILKQSFNELLREKIGAEKTGSHVGAEKTGAEKLGSQVVAEKNDLQTELLREKIGLQSGLNFSKHAIKRVTEREIGIENSEQIDKLSEGFKIAEQKGLSNALILTDTSAFIVNVKNNTVITAIGKSEMQGNAFTNIDGAVIV